MSTYDALQVIKFYLITTFIDDSEPIKVCVVPSPFKIREFLDGLYNVYEDLCFYNSRGSLMVCYKRGEYIVVEISSEESKKYNKIQLVSINPYKNVAIGGVEHTLGEIIVTFDDLKRSIKYDTSSEEMVRQLCWTIYKYNTDKYDGKK